MFYVFGPIDIVFANSTCFDDELMKKISKRAEGMKSGSKFITLTKSLSSEAFLIVNQRQYVMSWSPATAYIHLKIK